ncbi:MAG: hypothetical protein ACREBK_00830 [Sphingomicrobium sp.]
MTYGHRIGEFIENGPAELAEQLRLSRTTARNWSLLDRERRLALVEHALRPANDQIDAYPLAL